MNCWLIATRFLVVWSCAVPGVCFSQAGSGADILLERTAAAPVAAGGVATLERENGGAALAATIQQLAPGYYQLSAVTRADQTAVFLGVLVVSDPTIEPHREANDNQKEDSTAHQSERWLTQIKVPLPPELGLADVAEIDVFGPGGSLLLFGKVRVPPLGGSRQGE